MRMIMVQVHDTSEAGAYQLYTNYLLLNTALALETFD